MASNLTWAAAEGLPVSSGNLGIEMCFWKESKLCFGITSGKTQPYQGCFSSSVITGRAGSDETRGMAVLSLSLR